MALVRRGLMSRKEITYVLIFLGIVLFQVVDWNLKIAISVGILFLIYLEIRPFLKRRKIFKSSIVRVKKIQLKYPDLPLIDLGCPLLERSKSLRAKKLIELIFPRLNSEGQLEYVFSQHPLHEIRFVNLNKKKVSRELALAKEILPLIPSHLAIDKEITKLLDERQKLDEISSLVATSKVYNRQQEIYERAKVQLNDIIKKAYELKNIYVTLIREGLIGLKVAQYSSDNFIDNRILFDTQYQQLQQEYQLLKDSADAYAELSLSSKN